MIFHSFCLTDDIDTFNYQVLVCFPDDENFFIPPAIKNLIYGCISLISSLFFGLISIIYLTLPQLRSIQDKSVIALTFSFMVSSLILGLQLFLTPSANDTECKIIGKFYSIF